MLEATNALAKKFQTEFPALKFDKRQEYLIMAELHDRPAVQRINTKVVFAAAFLVLIITVLLVNKFRRKPGQPFE